MASTQINHKYSHPNGSSHACRHCTNQAFESKEELDEHLIEKHPGKTNVYYLETECKHGGKCCRITPKDGKYVCGFVHNPKIPTSFNVSEEGVPQGVCQYEQPWNNKRCTNEKCTWAHLRGRVKWLLEQQKKKDEE
jgi:hypothetical protein